MNQPLAIPGPDGVWHAAARVLPDGTFAATAAVAGEAPCCCDDEPPVFGDWCFVQIFRCSCWDATQSRWFPAHRLYVDGQIKPVYRIDGECWYTGRSVVLTPNFATPGYPFYITNDAPGIVTAWYSSCAEGGCTTNQCPCIGSSRLWTSAGSCGLPTVRVCARYVTLDFTWESSVSRTLIRTPCPSTNINSNSSASGRIVFDLFTNQVVSVSISNSASANGTAPDGTPQNPCRTRQVAYTFTRQIGPSDTFGSFGFPAWQLFSSVINGDFFSRSNGFAASSGGVPVADQNRSPDHEQPGYQPQPGSECLLTFDFFQNFGSGSVLESHRITRNPFSESVSWRQELTSPTGSSVASGTRSYALSFAATVPDIQPPTCPDAVLGQPCSGTGTIGIDVAGSLLNAADFNRVAIVDGRCYTPEPDIAPSGVDVTQWTANCSDAVCGDGPPPGGGGDGGDDTPDGGEIIDTGPRSTGLVSEAYLESMGLTPEIAEGMAGRRGCCDPPNQR